MRKSWGVIMSKFIDITGKKYNMLTVVKRIENAGGMPRWLCKCDCGNFTKVRGSNLKSGVVKSCGCLLHRPTHTHNMSHTPLYRVWNGMKQRCNNPNTPSYKNYGGRGITVCDEWNNSFDAFYEWASKGYAENLTLERIDNEIGYCPENCRWIPKSEQAKNRRSVLKLQHNGETHSLAEWSKLLNVDYKLVHNRICKLGWTFEKAISVPCDINKRNRKDSNG